MSQSNYFRAEYIKGGEEIKGGGEEERGIGRAKERKGRGGRGGVEERRGGKGARGEEGREEEERNWRKNEMGSGRMRGRVNERRVLHRDPKGGEGRGLGEVVLGDEGSGNPGRRRGRMEEERRIRKRRRREEEERKGGENERMGRRGGVLGDAGSRNPGRRPRVPAGQGGHGPPKI